MTSDFVVTEIRANPSTRAFLTSLVEIIRDALPMDSSFSMSLGNCDIRIEKISVQPQPNRKDFGPIGT